MSEPRIMRADEAAVYLGYTRASAAFYDRIKSMGVKPVWPGAYDRVTIDAALDAASKLLTEPADEYGDVNYG